MSVKPYEVGIPQATLDDLHERLAATRWTDEVAGAGWEYGANLAYIKQLCEYWQDGFDWRAQEAAINRFHHFRAELDGFGVHFVHERAQGEGAMALVLLHGWPGSFYQMLKIIPMLTDPAAHGGDARDSFDVITPDLPGYGFSDRPTEKGMNAAGAAELIVRLLGELGYERYGVRASDLGAAVAPQMALLRPDAVVGLHMSGSNPTADYEHVPDDLSDAERKMVEDAKRFVENEFAYAKLHMTKPQTPAIALNDSPAGLAAWIVEKFRAWSDNGGDVEESFTRDELLTHLTIYWATETIGSSMRMYYENLHSAASWGQVSAPTAMAMLPADMFRTPREWVERYGKVDRWTELPRGGHFGEQEAPELLAEDIRAFFRPLRASQEGAAAAAT
jgi:pimeloyl-ACP methyl ester carboxylesterase